MFLILIGSLIYLLIYAQKRKIKYLLDKERAEAIYAQELLTSRIESAEQTLQNISWDLHDNIGQLLSVASLQLKLIAGNVKGDQITEVNETSQVITECLNQVRTLSKSLDPEILQHNGLQNSLQIELERIKRLIELKYKFDFDDDIILDNDQEIIIFRMLQEFIANTIKHAKATLIEISILKHHHVIDVSILDNGVGFDLHTVKWNSGLIHMRSRAKLLDGKFSLKSVPGYGTKMTISIPITTYEKN